MKLNREKLFLSIRSIQTFIDRSLVLSYKTHTLTGFELSKFLFDASAHNTYVETVGNKADTLYSRIKEVLPEMIYYSYLDYIKRLSDKFDWKSKKFILAFDYTDEDFYGNVQGFDIHGWTKKNGVTGKFKFLTCSIVSDEISEKIPLISVPIRLGHYKSQTIIYCLSLIKNYIGPIELILFDRGFFDKDLMCELIKSEYPFLIFVPKYKDKKEILYPMEKEEKIAIYWNDVVRKDKTKYDFDFILAFLKSVYDKKSDKNYDWVFATNVEELELSGMIQTYKKRWRIETSFRVQDEAKIKCKSKEMKIRFFLFIFQQLLQSIWISFYKEEVSFKEFLIETQKICNSMVENPKRSYKKKILKT
jgi:hypothetical protein